MPLFDLVCNNCSIEQEDVMVRKDLMACCPRCREVMVKQVGKVSFTLKGQGWAKDGYKGN